MGEKECKTCKKLRGALVGLVGTDDKAVLLQTLTGINELPPEQMPANDKLVTIQAIEILLNTHGEI